MNNDQTVFEGHSSRDLKSPQQTPNTPSQSAPEVISQEPDLQAPNSPSKVPSEAVFQRAPLSVETPKSEISQDPMEMPTPPLPPAPEMISEEVPPIENPSIKDFQVAQQSVEVPLPPPPPPPSGINTPPELEEENYFGSNTFSTVKKATKILIGLIVVLFVLALVFLVVIPNFSKGSPKQVTLTYWGLWEDGSVMQGLISDFERQNPNIKIDYSKQDIKQYRERLVTRIANGTGPDVFRFHNSWYPMLAGGLLALPSDTISKTDFNNYFYPVAQNDLIKNGAIYGVPLEVDTLSLFINDQLFQTAGLQPPTNWNDFINAARAITVKDSDGKIKTAGAAMGAYENITHAPDIISLLFLQNGVNLNNFSNAADRTESALTFYTSFVTDQNNVWDSTLDPSILAFSKGNLAMYFGYSWDYYTIKQANPNLDFKIVPVPQLPNQHVTLASYWVEGASTRSKHPKEALLFMKYLAQKDTAEKFYTETAKTRAFGEPYARTDLADTLKTNKIIYPVVSQASGALSSFMVDSTYDDGLNQQSDTYLENAVNSILNQGSVQSAFSTLSQGVSQVLQKYGQ